MNHLDALCCDACRAKVTAIEARDQVSAVMMRDACDEFTAQVINDRHTLLEMVEQLLGTVAAQRERLRKAEAILVEVIKADALLSTPPPVIDHAAPPPGAE